MPLQIDNTDGKCMITMDGDLTIFQMAAYHEQLLAACQASQEMHIDLSRIEGMDAAGVQLLLAVHKQLAAAGGNLSLASPSDETLRVLTLFNLTDLFGVNEEVS